MGMWKDVYIGRLCHGYWSSHITVSLTHHCLPHPSPLSPSPITTVSLTHHHGLPNPYPLSPSPITTVSRTHHHSLPNSYPLSPSPITTVSLPLIPGRMLQCCTHSLSGNSSSRLVKSCHMRSTRGMQHVE